MIRLPLIDDAPPPRPSAGPAFWRSLDELTGTPACRERLERWLPAPVAGADLPRAHPRLERRFGGFAEGHAGEAAAESGSRAAHLDRSDHVADVGRPTRHVAEDLPRGEVVPVRTGHLRRQARGDP